MPIISQLRKKGRKEGERGRERERKEICFPVVGGKNKKHCKSIKLCILISKTNSYNEWFIALSIPENFMETEHIQKANRPRKSGPLEDGAWSYVVLKAPGDRSMHPGWNY